VSPWAFVVSDPLAGEVDVCDAPLAANYPAALLRPRQQAQVPVSVAQELVLWITSTRELVSALYAELIIVSWIIIETSSATELRASLVAV